MKRAQREKFDKHSRFKIEYLYKLSTKRVSVISAMNKHETFRKFSIVGLLWLLFWVSASALAQNAPQSVRVYRDCDDNVFVDWSAVAGVSSYSVSISGGGSPDERRMGSTGETSLSLGNLQSGSYNIFVDTDQGTYGTTSASLGRSNCPEFVPPPPHFDCADIPHRVILNAIGQGTNCQTVVPGGIGDPSLIAAGVLDAIDIWGRASDVRICFLQRGRLVFVDTSMSPRVVSHLPAEYIDGMTCGALNRTGMVALLRPDETAAVIAPDPAPLPEQEEAVSADVCQVTAADILSLRAGPSVFYTRLETMPRGTRLLAEARNGDWILVKFKGQWGWSSGMYLTQSAGCDALGESTRVYLPLRRESESSAGEEQAEPLSPAQAESIQPGAYVLIDCRLTTGDIINLRAEPGTEHSILAEIPFRTQLIALDRSGDWFQVEYDGNTGWVNIDYVFRRGACG